MAYRFVFGPVHSRRMGYSLGIDPVPRKTCSMDCIYCEVGPTDKWTMERREWVPVGDILEEVRRKLAEQHRIDVITFSGSGEPVLHSGLGAIIDGIRRMTDLPIAVLTNGSYMDDAAVRADLARADIVVPSLDAVTPEVFQAINRPHRKLRLEDVIAGLKAFRREFQGKLWLEVLLVEGVNDGDEEIRQLAEVAAEIDPDRIDLNTVVRPPACEGVRGVSPERLERIREMLGPRAFVVGRVSGQAPPPAAVDLAEEIAEIAARRPVTRHDLIDTLGRKPGEIESVVRTLLEAGRLRERIHDDQLFLEVPPPPGSRPSSAPRGRRTSG
jgi:wyosine [tRNA(Phe)-imidazoG37] synthetase (radical SAM superfamily)